MESKLSILYVYQNKDVDRLFKSLNSLSKQTEKGFSVYILDFGSDVKFERELDKTVVKFPFASLVRFPLKNQIWSRAKAFNVLIRKVKTPFVFTADIDIIFSEDFFEKMMLLVDETKVTFFQVGFLNRIESQSNKNFEDYQVSFKSQPGAGGLSLFPVKALQKVGGFDEFFHFWGAEDTDIHNRLTLAGYTVDFYDKEVLLLHQWHPIYRAGREVVLTAEPRLTNVVRLNHQHLQHNLQHQIINPNRAHWGQMPDRKKAIALQQATISQTLTNRKEVIDHFLYCEWSNHKGLLAVRFTEDNLPKTPKYRIKKALGKSVPQYYILKEINDLILMQLITTFRNFPYTYQVDLQQRCILLKVFL